MELHKIETTRNRIESLKDSLSTDELSNLYCLLENQDPLLCRLADFLEMSNETWESEILRIVRTDVDAAFFPQFEFPLDEFLSMRKRSFRELPCLKEITFIQ